MADVAIPQQPKLSERDTVGAKVVRFTLKAPVQHPADRCSGCSG